MKPVSMATAIGALTACIAAVAIGVLLMTLQTRAERCDSTPRRPGDWRAAAHSAQTGRPTADVRLDIARFADAATRRFARFSSAIGPDIPAAQPLSRVSLSDPELTRP